MSAWEITHQRDQTSGVQLPFFDEELASKQLEQRKQSHTASAKCKARGGPPAQLADVKQGSLVYIKSDGNKVRGRDRYIVTAIDNEFCTLQKFINTQFRSPQYRLKLTEIYPVNSDLCEYEQNESYLSGTDSDEDIVRAPIVQPDNLPQIGSAENDNIEQLHNDNNALPDVELSTSADDYATSDPCNGDIVDSSSVLEDLPTSSNDRPPRTRRKPAWMTSGTYELK